MGKWSRGLFLLPAAGMAAAALVGFQTTKPVFPEINYPQEKVLAAKLDELEKESIKRQEALLKEQEENGEPSEEEVTVDFHELQEKSKKKSDSKKEKKAEGHYEDGVYRGTGTGFKGDVTVEVTVKQSQITKIEVLSYQDDDAFFTRARALTNQMIKMQTWEVDAVSGATYSSRGIKEAVKNALTGSTEKSAKAAEPTEEKPLTVSVYTGSGTWRDGTYYGSGTGFGGTIRVSVTILEGKISAIQVLDHSGETPSYYEKGETIVSRILTAQSPNVDTVSGATYSSHGIKQAVIQALSQAGGENEAEPKKEEKPSGKEEKKKKTKQKDKKKKETSQVTGEPANGTFEGSAECERYGYTIHLKVKFKGGKAVSIKKLKITGNEDPANEAFWKKAWKPVTQSILASQSYEVDAVSGATYSSEAIMEAYLDAYTQAVKKNGGKVKDSNSKGENSGDTKNTGSKDSDKSKDIEPTEPIDPKEQVNVDSDTQVVRDGTYTVTATCSPDEYEDFEPYELTADVTFLDGKLTGMANFHSTDESNKGYYLQAVNGGKTTEGILNQLLAKQSADAIDAVTGATCSSKTVCSLYLKALKMALEEKEIQQENSEEAVEANAEKADSENTENVAGNSTGNGVNEDAEKAVGESTEKVASEGMEKAVGAQDENETGKSKGKAEEEKKEDVFGESVENTVRESAWNTDDGEIFIDKCDSRGDTTKEEETKQNNHAANNDGAIENTKIKNDDIENTACEGV